MLNFVGKTVKKTGEVVIGIANSGLVKGASKLGATAAKGGIEGAAWVSKKAIDGVREAVPKIKNIDRHKISANIGKVTNKTMVGIDGDYQTIGKAINSSKVGKLYTEKTGETLMKDSTAIRRRGSLDNRPKTTYVATGKSFGLMDAVTDRAKMYVDGAVHIAKGDSYLTGKQPLLKTGADNFMPFGLKATGLGTTLAVGGSLVSGVPDAAKQWNNSKKGTNQDSQVTSVAPRTPAYSNNGGATGDLVFALNNLRHGGMM